MPIAKGVAYGFAVEGGEDVGSIMGEGRCGDWCGESDELTSNLESRAFQPETAYN